MMKQLSQANPKENGRGRLLIASALALASSSFLISSCSSKNESTTPNASHTAASAPAQANQSPSKVNEQRMENKTVGLSYVLPDGFSESSQGLPAGFPATQILPKGGSLLGPVIRILKITSETSSPQFDATKTNDENVDARVDALTTKKPGYGVSGVKRDHWDGDGLPASSVEITLSSTDGAPKIHYFFSYIGQGADRWTLMTTDDGTGAGKFLGEEAKAIAKSIRKLPN
ncbi:hypothetical protein [Segniliparus rugosus]|uniref:Uncharacterized protein n=1 Tax=Segniliparus rugosus (strain ATCC BAA-974 / DSM 45345 / CCUG 50838 / CIP 108380 / JCM 13579 / CDC 945) TaxID=679197 RepID=U1M2N1_SEGRC|nr:hypothetical protein [Segniliparus rugosus]ERG69370.1 hypothetical protein HMPREF9336_04066 [Segniliparus rugosus ATCC BAA-974]